MSASDQAGGEAGLLRREFGDFVELREEGGGSIRCRIAAELTVGGRRYAILQSEAQRKDGEIEVFRIAADADGAPLLETVEDDEEWENAAEAYDDLLFGDEQRP